MADTKISALPASTTPLAGTEVLPIVQSGATKQVSVADLTAGRAISATQLTLTTENLIIGTSGKGIDFSATSGTGTSELLNDYEEGTWTPNLAGTEVLTNVAGVYTKIGRQVTVSFKYTVTTLGTGSSTTISGLPFTSSSLAHGGVVTYFENIAANVTYLMIRTNASANTLQLCCLTAANATIQNVSINQNGAVIYGTLTYFV